MATAITIPLEEYLRTTYHPDCEWVDGELKGRAVGEGSHGYIQKFFILYFGNREQAWDVRVMQEVRVQVTARNFRVPDVHVMRSTDAFEEIVYTPPLLCIEILSPDDRMAEMQEKIDEYLAMGVRMVWVVNPKRERAYMVDDGGMRQVEELTVPGTAIRISVAEVFEGLNRLKSGAESV